MNNKKQKGFYTIEAIVATIVFVVGIVGILQIQRNAIQTTSDAQYRTNATYLADSMIGQMWVDRPNIAIYDAGTGDFYEAWMEELRASLPGVADNPPNITVNTVNGIHNVSIEIFWKIPDSEVLSRHFIQTSIY